MHIVSRIIKFSAGSNYVSRLINFSASSDSEIVGSGLCPLVLTLGFGSIETSMSCVEEK